MQGLTNYLWNLKVGRIWASRLQHWKPGTNYTILCLFGDKGELRGTKKRPKHYRSSQTLHQRNSWTVRVINPK